MASKRFVKFNITASSSGLHPLEWYVDDDGRIDEDEIGAIFDEQAWDILEEDDYASWDIDFAIVEKDVDE